MNATEALELARAPGSTTTKLTVSVPDSIDRFIRGYAGFNRITISEVAVEALELWMEQKGGNMSSGLLPAGKPTTQRRRAADRTPTPPTAA